MRKMSDVHELDSIADHTPRYEWKKGIRVLGVSESFSRQDKKSFVAGVIMRGDMRMDGFGFCRPKVGGKDATDQLLSMYDRLNREDIRAWMLGGCVISWFNVVDSVSLYENTDVPVVCLSYNPSEGLESYFKEYFPEDWKVRMALMDRGGPRREVTLKTNHKAFLTTVGISITQARKLVDKFTFDGRIPEPIRVARLIASSLKRDQMPTELHSLG